MTQDQTLNSRSNNQLNRKNNKRVKETSTRKIVTVKTQSQSLKVQTLDMQ